MNERMNEISTIIVVLPDTITFVRSLTRIRVQIRIGHFRKLGLDGLQGLLRDGFQPRIRPPTRFRLEPHPRTVGTTRLIVLTVRPRTVPRQTNHGTVQTRSVPAFFGIGFNDIDNGFPDLLEVNDSGFGVFAGVRHVRVEKDC